MNKNRIFVINSLDGKDLFVGDDFYWARKKEKGDQLWYLEHHEEQPNIYRFTFNKDTYEKALVFAIPTYNKAFSKKSEAEKFIKQSNGYKY